MHLVWYPNLLKRPGYKAIAKIIITDTVMCVCVCVLQMDIYWPTEGDVSYDTLVVSLVDSDSTEGIDVSTQYLGKVVTRLSRHCGKVVTTLYTVA